MRILVFSDTHGRTQGCISTLDCVDGVDMVLHAGDMVTDAKKLSSLYPDIVFHYVTGNNDPVSSAPGELLVAAAGKKIFLTHGHFYRVKQRLDLLAARAANAGADIAVFGHTHAPCDRLDFGVRLLNPGSMGHICGSYAVIEIDSGALRIAVINCR